MIQHGYLNYTLNTNTGQFHYQGEIVAKKFFFTKVVPLEGTEQVDPELLRSHNVKVGKVVDLPPFRLEVKKLGKTYEGKSEAFCDLELGGEFQFTGTALLDISEEFLAIKSLRAKGTVYGYEVNLNVVEA